METDIREMGILSRLRWFNHISRRMIAGYLVIVCLPIILYFSLYVDGINKRNAQQEAAQQQYWLSYDTSRLAARLASIEEIGDMLQFNSLVLDFLQSKSGMASLACDYMNDISPLFRKLKLIDSHINGVFIYLNNEKLLRFLAEFRQLKFQKEDYQIGQWVYVTDNEHPHSNRPNDSKDWLVYRKNLYDSNYNSWLGVMEIRVSVSILDFFLSSSTKGTTKAYMLLDKKGNQLLNTFSNDSMLSSSSIERIVNHLGNDGTWSLDGDDGIIHAIFISPLQCYFICETQEKTTSFDPIHRWEILLTLVLLLFIFSVFYFAIVGRILHRVSWLANTMRTTIPTDLQKIVEKNQSSDEIGYLYSSYNNLIEKIRDLVKTVRNEESMRNAAAYAALQTKIQPHFLYGTLETIRMMAIRDGNSSISELTYSFGKLMRYSLGQSSTVTLAEEIESCTYYLEVQKTRLGDRLTYSLDVWVDPSQVKCPRFILQPIIENAIEHGIAKKKGGGSIVIHVEETTDNKIILRVIDDGIGIEKDKLIMIHNHLREEDDGLYTPENNGFALHSVHKRIMFFYGRAYGLSIDSISGQGTTVTAILGRKESIEHAENHDS